MEDATKGVHCKGLSATEVGSTPDVLRIIHRAQEKRRVGETKMNKASSRSHCIFTLTVAAKEKVADGEFLLDRVGKLHLVDLAGSGSATTDSISLMSAYRSVFAIIRVCKISRD